MTRQRQISLKPERGVSDAHQRADGDQGRRGVPRDRPNAAALARSASTEFHQRDRGNAIRRTTGARPENGLRAAADGTRLLTVAQAAEACQVSQRQIRRMIRDGRIKVRRFGRSVRIRPADLGL